MNGSEKNLVHLRSSPPFAQAKSGSRTGRYLPARSIGSRSPNERSAEPSVGLQMLQLTGIAGGSPDDAANNNQPMEVNPKKYCAKRRRMTITATVLAFWLRHPAIGDGSGWQQPARRPGSL
jgi:hypothetical protein